MSTESSTVDKVVLGSCLESNGPNSPASWCLLENHQRIAHFSGKGPGGQ